MDPRVIVIARAHPNIALVKYWGNRDERLRLPANGSISVNLAGLETATSIAFDAALPSDVVEIDGAPAERDAAERVARHLDRLRVLSGTSAAAQVVSRSNFPAGTGIASSSSAFAALTVAGCAALGLSLGERELSRIARAGSGSAARSIPDGFVELETGPRDEEAFAHSLAAHDHWDIVDCIALVSREPKQTGSTEGHRLAATSPLQAARVSDSPRRLALCRQAIRERDFDLLAQVVEEDCLQMHAVMMTSRPALLYWVPATLEILRGVRGWRADGLPVAFTIDAGPNVHCLCEGSAAAELEARLREIPGVQETIVCHPGPGAALID
jgi:diphosphomevalonate decarboxylase